MGTCTSKPPRPNLYAPTGQDIVCTEDDNKSPAKNDSGAEKKTPMFPFSTPSPAHYLFGKKSASSPANSTPRKFFRRPPSPANHIKAVLLRRKGGVKGVDEEEDWGGLDKSFGFSKEFRSCYEVGKEVGRGHFGYTCAAKCLKGELKGEQVAVKIIPKSKVSHIHLLLFLSVVFSIY